MKKKLIITAILALCALTGAQAQYYGIKTNAAMLPTGTVNAGFEVSLAKQWSLDVSGYWNPISTDKLSAKFWYVQPGVRYWRYEHFVGPFIGGHATYGQYTVGNDRWYYDGWFTGAGVSAGYSWILTDRWNFTLEGGLGLYYMCDTKYWHDYSDWEKICVRHYRRVVLAPSKIEASFSFLF